MGPVMLDLNSTSLQADERELLAHPAVGGVILFSRNFSEQAQLLELVREVRAVRPELLLAVDHEGGRVQRFRQDFTLIPAMGSFRQLADQSQALRRATAAAYVMASEVRACGIDISFAPVADLHGISEVIGDRSFSADVGEAVTLLRAFIQGMRAAGMASTGKHFPGHGSVREDSHIAIPVDKRSEAEIRQLDLAVFRQLMAEQLLDAVMPAHVIYPAVDEQPAGFSHRWLQQILRSELAFDGVIFSDDLCMAGAHVAGSVTERAAAALNAGCDMLLVCNDRPAAEQVVEWVGGAPTPLRPQVAAMVGAQPQGLLTLRRDPRWQEAQAILHAG